jgi:hypothetical protein
MYDVFVLSALAGLIGCVAIVTSYLLADDTQLAVFIAEVLICFFAAVACGNNRY